MTRKYNRTKVRDKGSYHRKISRDCLDAFIDEEFRQADVARCCNMSRERIRQLMNDRGIDYQEFLKRKRAEKLSPIIDLVNKGHTVDFISERLGIPRYVLNSIMRNNNICPVRSYGGFIEKLAEIILLRNKGYSKSDIAEWFGCTSQHINAITNGDVSRKNILFKRYFPNVRFVNGVKGYMV